MSNLEDAINSCCEHKEGRLYWKAKTSVKSSRIVIGSEIGYPDKDGYLKFCIAGKDMRVHRVIAYLNGVITFNELLNPSIMIDHKDGNVRNNLPSNLRAVTNSDNLLNTKAHREGKPKFINKVNGGYIIRIRGEYLGFYQTLEAAVMNRDNHLGVTCKI